jgi:diguanylate cyclase (GGDEF)-like protein
MPALDADAFDPPLPAGAARPTSPAGLSGFEMAGVDDVLVFKHSDVGFSLLGGAGRGVGWAGVVDLEPGDDSLVGRAWRAGALCRQAGTRAQQVAGPYHARHAAAVPVGQRYVVLFGANRPIELREPDFVRLAVAAVDRIHGVPADKLLADELELVHAVRALMAYRPENVRDTMRHVATVAAQALSCDVALIRVDHDGEPITEAVHLDAPDSTLIGPAADGYLAQATLSATPPVEQATPRSAGAGVFGVDVVSRMALRLGADPAIGTLALGHASVRPRGFTSLCQRIGRALADAAELLITQAMAREQLAAERDLLARISGIDALTGIANRRGWDEAAAGLLAASRPEPAAVLSCDLDRLKEANDRYGHAAGDTLLRATANLLRSCVRDRDLVARIGGDEFAVLLRAVDDRTAARIRRRIRRAEHVWRVTEHGLSPQLSLGLAPVIDNDLEAARQVADRRMYANKRRRRASAMAPNGARMVDRRLRSTDAAASRRAGP